ncbi:MAG: hypothetical protein B7Z66_03765 [Chromatiales bacterium 21-64-14]|nr:MAG: hypothetical protein B7Z66_03765 [Chromatiales bacterium 21-64-14]HQU14804.1 DUF2066 domain-containing protein [Gammaproteobacteria bacterium]
MAQTRNRQRGTQWPRAVAASAILGLLLIAASAQARMVRGLYAVEEPVTGQGVTERLAAFRAGLAEVFERVSGNATAASDPGLIPALQDPARFVLEYRYLEQGTGPTPGPTPSPTPSLWVRFDPGAVHQALQAAHLPVWGSARPTTLVWLAVEDGMQRAIVGADAQSPVEQSLMKAAGARGIPVLLPLMDLEDEGRLSFGDLWGDFGPPIRKASARYDTHAILVGRVVHRPSGDWQARWTLYLGDHTVGWVSGAATEDALIETGVNGIADRLAARFAVPAGDRARTLVRVSIGPVGSLSAYARVLSYLRHLGPVLHVQPVEVRPSQAIFRVEVQGDVQSLTQAISLGRTLESQNQNQIPSESQPLSGPQGPGQGRAVVPGAPGTASPAIPDGGATITLRYRLVS